MKQKPLGRLVFILLAILGISNAFSANAADSFVEATDYSWGVISNNDGFDKTLAIYKDADNRGITDYGDDITYTAELQCTKKKLTFMVYADPIGIYPVTSYTSTDGYASAKIDNGRILKYPYISLKDSSGIFFKSPKTVTAAILKGRDTFSFKILSSVQENTVANFSIGDFASYASKFKSLGCPLK
jgi:hypothetical protein